MNAEQIFPLQPPAGSAQMPQTDEPALLVGAWLDGELSEAELTAWLSEGVEPHAVAARVQVYQLIGDAFFC